MTSLTRSAVLPEVPTMAEAAFPGYDMPAWRSIMGPAGVRADVVVSFNAALARARSKCLTCAKRWRPGFRNRDQQPGGTLKALRRLDRALREDREAGGYQAAVGRFIAQRMLAHAAQPVSRADSLRRPLTSALNGFGGDRPAGVGRVPPLISGSFAEVCGPDC